MQGYLNMISYVPSALLTGRVVRRNPGALRCSGWRAEGALGLVALMLGLMIVILQRSFRSSWSG